MTMVRFTYTEGNGDSVVATWTPEYGVVIAGAGGLLGRVIVEEIEPRALSDILARDPLPLKGDADLLDDDDLGDDGTRPPVKCFSCNHPWHESMCDRFTGGLPCDCSTAVA